MTQQGSLSPIRQGPNRRSTSTAAVFDDCFRWSLLQKLQPPHLSLPYHLQPPSLSPWSPTTRSPASRSAPTFSPWASWVPSSVASSSPLAAVARRSRAPLPPSRPLPAMRRSSSRIS